MELKSPPFALLLGKLFANFSAGVKAGSEHHRTIRQALRQAPNTLIDLTNDLLRTANESLQKKARPHGLLLLFDNLDRYPPETIGALLLKGASLVRPLACHAIFTMPINLHYDPGEAYQDAYGGPAAILPMLSLRTPNERWSSKVADSSFTDSGVDDMLAALKKRLDVTVLFQDPDDARLLVKMSGGCMRDLLHLVTLACQKSRENLAETLTRVTSNGVRRAIAEYRATLTEGLLNTDHQRLAAIAHREPEALGLDGPLLQLLARRLALRYQSGDTRWTDVHPLVIETEGFQRAFTATSRITAG